MCTFKIVDRLRQRKQLQLLKEICIIKEKPRAFSLEQQAWCLKGKDLACQNLQVVPELDGKTLLLKT